MLFDSFGSPSRNVRIGSVALVLSPLILVGGIVLGRATFGLGDIVLVQHPLWKLSWAFVVLSGLLLAVGATVVFDRLASSVERFLSISGIASAWIVVLLQLIMYALSVFSAAMLVVPGNSASLPQGHQPAALNIVEAITTGLILLSIVFIGVTIANLGLALVRGGVFTDRLGYSGVGLGGLTAIGAIATLASPGPTAFGRGVIILQFLAVLSLGWGGVLGFAALRKGGLDIEKVPSAD